MEEKRYIISDASKMVEVESHVLRYWEEELGISIPRNEMGHRYYTDFYIDLFKKIKELKDSGFQLKAIKILIPELMAMNDKGNENVDVLKEELFSKLTDITDETMSMDDGDDNAGAGRNTDTESVSGESLVVTSGADSPSETMGTSVSKLEQFQTIISEVVSSALKANTDMLGKEVSEIVSDNVIKEMDYLMHIREKQEEERFRKLDETIRNCQIARKENAKAGKGIIGKLKRLQN